MIRRSNMIYSGGEGQSMIKLLLYVARYIYIDTRKKESKQANKQASDDLNGNIKLQNNDNFQRRLSQDENQNKNKSIGG